MAPSDEKKLKRIQQAMKLSANLTIGMRAAGQLVVHCAFGRDSSRPFCSRAPLFEWIENQNAVIRGTIGHQFCDLVTPLVEDTVIEGEGISAFSGTNLQTILSSRGIDTLILGGFAAHWTVESTGRDAADRGYQLIVATDCCESGEPENKSAALDRLSNLGQLLNSSQIQELLNH